MVRSVASFRVLGICVTSSISRILVPKFWGLEWQFLSLQVPVLGYQSNVVNEAIRRNSFFLIRNFKWKKTQKKNLLLFLFNIRLFFFSQLVFTCFVFFVSQKVLLKKKIDFVLIASFTLLLMCIPFPPQPPYQVYHQVFYAHALLLFICNYSYL